MRIVGLLGLIVSMGIILYLGASQFGKPSQPGESNKNLLDKPSEVRTEVNKALQDTQKAREKAINESK